MAFELRTGKRLGPFGKGGNGGVWGLVTPEGVFFHGRGQNHGSNGELREFDTSTRQRLMRFPKARRVAIAGNMAYLLAASNLTAFDWARYLPLSREHARNAAKLHSAQARLDQLRRGGKDKGEEAAKLRAQAAELRKRIDALKKSMDACLRWRVSTPEACSLMVASDLVFVGGDNIVAAFDRASGRQRWTAKVTGKAYGLAAAKGRLFVSTDAGAIYAFESH